MEKLEALQSQLAAIEAEIARIKDQGEVLMGARLELVAPGGTASAKAKESPKYGRLRMGRGCDRTSKYVPLKEIAETQAAIERGRQVAALERQAKALTKRIDALSAKLAAIGT